jgi:hypothetical protein
MNSDNTTEAQGLSRYFVKKCPWAIRHETRHMTWSMVVNNMWNSGQSREGRTEEKPSKKSNLPQDFERQIRGGQFYGGGARGRALIQQLPPATAELGLAPFLPHLLFLKNHRLNSPFIIFHLLLFSTRKEPSDTMGGHMSSLIDGSLGDKARNRVIDDELKKVCDLEDLQISQLTLLLFSVGKGNRVQDYSHSSAGCGGQR